MQAPSKEAKWFVLNIDERTHESDVGQIVRIERTGGDFCGCCGTYGRCGGPGGGGRICGAFAFVCGVFGAVCLLVMVWSLDSFSSDLLGESASGSGM